MVGAKLNDEPQIKTFKLHQSLMNIHVNTSIDIENNRDPTQRY
jgi:hypothetical protein